MVRDLAKHQGKELELVVEGAEINVDKRILEEMKDPMAYEIKQRAEEEATAHLRSR